jgi:hypothetical protein
MILATLPITGVIEITRPTIVKESLIEAGFFINEEKSGFNPVTKLEWLGIV